MQLILWGRSSAYNVQKVLWTLAELGLSYEHIEVGGIPGQLDTPEFLAMNPHGRIPILADGVNVIWESNAIVRYLSAKYSAGSLWSVDPAERSYADRWMDWELATFQPDFLALFWSFYRTPVAQRDQDVIQNALARCERHFRQLDLHLGKQAYLAGATFTMGDIPCATSLYRYFEMGVTVSELPNVKAWYRRLTERQAYRKHIMIPFEDLRGRITF